MRLDLARRYKRWRHGRGFGIHSPFAYDFITRTLRERMPYYAYERIDAFARSAAGCRLPADRLKLIFRIAVRFNPPKAAIIGDDKAAGERLALKSARHDIVISSGYADADLFVVCDDRPLPDSVRPNGVYIFPDKKRGGIAACENIWSKVTHGMRFDSSRSFTVIVTSPALPKQTFDVRF